MLESMLNNNDSAVTVENNQTKCLTTSFPYSHSKMNRNEKVLINLEQTL